MLLSKSGKVQYLCGKCGSPEVAGPIIIYGQRSIACTPCGMWYPWVTRRKKSAEHSDNSASGK